MFLNRRQSTRPWMSEYFINFEKLEIVINAKNGNQCKNKVFYQYQSRKVILSLSLSSEVININIELNINICDQYQNWKVKLGSHHCYHFSPTPLLLSHIFDPPQSREKNQLFLHCHRHLSPPPPRDKISNPICWRLFY